MTKNQEIKLELLKIFASSKNPVEECRKAFEYMQEDVESNIVESSMSEDKYDDGIYLVCKNRKPIPFESGMVMIKDLTSDVTAIGVVYDGHAFQVALQDIGGQTLNNEENNSSPDKSPFYKTLCESLHDWDFVGATNHLRECGMDIPLPEGWYIPTLAVLEAMLFLREKINAAIEFVGGKPMPEGYYWSCSEANNVGIRYVNFRNGSIDIGYKYGSCLVRPVSTF